jgi:hypothetical protein
MPSRVLPFVCVGIPSAITLSSPSVSRNAVSLMAMELKSPAITRLGFYSIVKRRKMIQRKARITSLAA